MADIKNNEAAWIVGEKVHPLEVRPGPDQTKPESNEVIIQVAALAINPTDPYIQDAPYLPLNYPHVLGTDVAGTVASVGSQVTRFKPGDRVIGHTVGLAHGGARHGGFQKFAACLEVGVAKIPDSLSFEKAAVLPLSISTSATGLYEVLKLRLPSVEAPKADPSGKETVLIWGGASSMGSTAIQFAVAAGYRVVTTASAKNFEYVKSLNASTKNNVVVFDYKDPDVVSKIIAHVKESGAKFVGGYDCISVDPSATKACVDVVHGLGGGPLPVVRPASLTPKWSALPEGSPEDVQGAVVWGVNPVLVPDHAGAPVWVDYIQEALRNGTFEAKPEPLVVGKSLGDVQAAMDLYKKGVSAQKIVVTL
ncbi:hypothetical protein JX265_007928 [Neoarthrinium moseri]|uniref:Enoyl reductase (ER) domain-containing protein n=1 Tax=Neoarthrinium moseri TaxID=1658444 RepID=A0A9P9WIT3_9PEZI|nr:hypothetical protein JX266_012467 [Neoarthrinium moseri]KAI1865605.1 hypothetical protein JX265_007928 [Neoarthrinium moseri]